MKTGELAKLLGTSVNTIRNWIDRLELQKFFSAAALGSENVQRELTESDVLVLNTVHHLRATGTTDWGQIAEYLDGGRRHRDFPANATSAGTRTISVQHAEQSAKVLATVAERDAALARVRELEDEIAALRADYERRLSEKDEKYDKLLERHISEMAKLQFQLGRLTGRLENQKPDDEPLDPS